MTLPVKWWYLLNDAADDLDRLEELEPRPGRVGTANDLRQMARAGELVAGQMDQLMAAFYPEEE